jgi:hypothetical protein
MEKVQKRQGLICVCAECKTVIQRIGDASDGETPLVSHGICAACADRLYGHIFRGTRRAEPVGDSPAGHGAP